MSAIASKTDTSREERCIYVRKALLPGPQRRPHIVLKSRWPRIEDDHQRRLDVADGLALDVAAGHIYWTNMGDPNRNDGSIMRSNLNGKNMITIVPPGSTFTPRQLQLEKRSGKLYWSDRKGVRVTRANLDGSEIEALVDTSLVDSRLGSDPRKWCGGIAVDTDGGKFDRSQKGGHDAGLGRMFRARHDWSRVNRFRQQGGL